MELELEIPWHGPWNKELAELFCDTCMKLKELILIAMENCWQIRVKFHAHLWMVGKQFAPQSKKAVELCAFQITCKLLSFTLEDS